MRRQRKAIKMHPNDSNVDSCMNELSETVDLEMKKGYNG
jgi:hypothetical protein